MSSKPRSAGEKVVRMDDLFKSSSPIEAIGATHTDELVVALCGPIGSPLHAVAEKLKAKLVESFGYLDCKVVRLSHLINDLAAKVDVQIPTGQGFRRINAQIDAGNKLREKHGRSVLAELAIRDIRVNREQFKMDQGAAAHKPRRVCHIIDSIKNQEEMDLLRSVYREMLYFVGVSVPLESREANLRARGLEPGEIYQLIDRDSGEESRAGQTVRNTYPQCDFFLRLESDTDAQLERKVERFLNLVLSARIETPYPHESAMYEAASVSANSACLSRQVGAAIVDAKGDLVSVGWNDVPRFGGGLYASSLEDVDGQNDHRCWNKDGGKCFNDEEKRLLSDAIVEALGDVIPESQRELARQQVTECGKLRNLIEFSRSVHAELHAIINAAKVGGDRMLGGRMFVTTYPCHSCARHIIAAGINEVHYIEPYRKSLAIKLHGDAMTERERDTEKVRVLSYEGVAPSRFLALFRMAADSRKTNGRMRKIPAKTASPRLEKSLEALPALEALVIKSLAAKNLIPNQEPGPNAPAAAPT